MQVLKANLNLLNIKEMIEVVDFNKIYLTRSIVQILINFLKENNINKVLINMDKQILKILVKDSINQTIVNKKVAMNIKEIKPNKIKENKDN